MTILTLRERNNLIDDGLLSMNTEKVSTKISGLYQIISVLKEYPLMYASLPQEARLLSKRLDKMIDRWVNDTGSITLHSIVEGQAYIDFWNIIKDYRGNNL